MVFYQMVFNHMVFDQMVFDQTVLDQMVFDQMVLDQMSAWFKKKTIAIGILGHSHNTSFYEKIYKKSPKS